MTFEVVRDLPELDRRHLQVEARQEPPAKEDRFAFAVSGGRSVGMLSAIRDNSIWTIKSLYVEPEWRMRGVGRALVADLERQVGRPLATDLIDSDDIAAAAFFVSLGWEIQEPTNMRYRRELATLPTVHTPSGYRVRTYQEGDEVHWMPLVRAAFATEGTGLVSERDDYFIRKYLGSNDTIANTVWIAVDEAEGNPVGTAIAQDWDLFEHREGRVSWLAVHPVHRGRGIGEALTLAALDSLKGRGCRYAKLDSRIDFRSAMRLYRRLGFELFHYTASFRLPTCPPAPLIH